MKSPLTTLAAAAVALTLAGSSLADSAQLAANAGLSPAEASALSLTQVAQAKFNRDSRGDDRQIVIVPGATSPEARAQLAANAGLSPQQGRSLSLTEVAAAKFNRDSAGDDAQRVERGTVTLATRSVRDPGARAQLVANAGLSQEEGSALSLTEIAKAKFARDTYN